VTAFADWLSWAGGEAAALLSSPQQIAATLAAALGVGLVVAGAFVRTMQPLRWLAAGSNAGLLVYGALHPSMTTLAVAGALLPINIYRAVEVTRLTRRVNRAQSDADMAGLWLRPHMKPRRMKAGQVLFKRGDRADRLYLLVEGEMELADIGTRLEIGRIFGEVALFSPSGLRTHTVRCITACRLLEIHEHTVMQMYYQYPVFGFHLIRLLASRLSADIQRMEAAQADNH
jgi:CRP/FNR family cyclic AMP-dependent transcriptional regulator